MTGKSEWLLVVLLSGMIAAGAFALTAQPLEALGVIHLSFWITSLLLLVVGFLSALVLIDLTRSFVACPSVAILGTVFYGVAIWSPALQLGEFSTHLFNYALVQSIPVFVITLVLITLGTMAGTIVNTSVREYDL